MHCAHNHSSLPTSFISLQFSLSPFSSQAALFYFYVFILCRHYAGSHLCCSSLCWELQHPCPTQKIVFHSNPSVFQFLFPHPPFPWSSLDLGWGVGVAFWLRSKQSLILIIWPVMSLCLDLCKASFIRTLISFIRAPPQWLLSHLMYCSLFLLSHCT